MAAEPLAADRLERIKELVRDAIDGGNGGMVPVYIAVDLLNEVDRLKRRLNHQTEDDIEACRQGRHEDCGADVADLQKLPNFKLTQTLGGAVDEFVEAVAKLRHNFKSLSELGAIEIVVELRRLVTPPEIVNVLREEASYDAAVQRAEQAQRTGAE